MRTIIDLPDEQVEALRKIGERSSLSRAELIRRAVSDYLREHKVESTDEAFGLWQKEPKDALTYQRLLREEWGE